VPRQISNAHTAIAPEPIKIISVQGPIPGHLETLYRDTRNAQQNLYLDGKTRAIPSLHRDYFLAKVPGPYVCSRRVTQPPFIAEQLWLIAGLSAR
jgi:hypothetical protein